MLSQESTGKKNTVCLLLELRVDDRMKIERTSNMVNVLEEFARNHNIVL